MPPKQKGGHQGAGRQKGANTAEEVEESLQAVVWFTSFSHDFELATGDMFEAHLSRRVLTAATLQ